jgi:hypothetical protein
LHNIAMAAMQRAARGERARDEELEIRFEDGSSLIILVNAYPLARRRAGTAGAICAATDIMEPGCVKTVPGD